MRWLSNRIPCVQQFPRVAQIDGTSKLVYSETVPPDLNCLVATWKVQFVRRETTNRKQKKTRGAGITNLIEFSWLMVAIATLLVAIATFHSNIYGNLKKISELNTTNTHLFERLSRISVEFYGIQTQVNRAHQDLFVAQAAVSHLHVTLRTLKGERSNLIKQNALIKNSVAQLQIRVKRMIDGIIRVSYTDRFRSFKNVARNGLISTIPTSASIRSEGGGEFTAYDFLFINKKYIPIQFNSKHMIDLGPVVVLEIKMNVSWFGKNLVLEAHAENVKNRIFQAFVHYLKEPLAGGFVGSKWHTGRLIDFLYVIRIAGAPGFSIGFIPGHISSLSYEREKIRAFWVSAIGGTIETMSTQAHQILKTAYKTSLKSISYPPTKDWSWKFTLNRNDLLSTVNNWSRSFGKSGEGYFINRERQLDRTWLETLENAKGPDGRKLFTFSSRHRLQPELTRWDWNDIAKYSPTVLLEDLETDRKVNNELVCLAAYFIEKNNISAGAEVTTTARMCQRVRTVLRNVLQHDGTSNVK